MSLLKKFASLSPLQSPAADTEKKQFDQNCDGNVENLKRVDVHWNNVKQIMAVDEKTVSSQERCNILVSHLNGIIDAILDERDENPGPCLQYVLHENIFHTVYSWSASRKDCALEMKSEQLKLFRNLIERGRSPILIYEQVWKPLLFLLHSCVDKIPPESEEAFVAVLKGLCVSVNRDIALLDLFFLDNHCNSQIAKLSVFSLLIPFVHREGNVGIFARDAMLLCMALSSVDHRLGRYIAEDTCFCPVLATGLSALYSDLPTSLEIASEDWYSLERGLWAIFPELVAFLTSLEFCNNVIQIAHPMVHVQLLDLIYNGFLISVMAPALHQSSTEALTAATAYLDLFIRSITDTNLMHVFIKFMLTEKFDDQPILDSLISRIGQDSQLAVVSLGLFHTLLELNCEDIMYSLVLKYLIPCSHILTSQRRTLQEVDFYSRSAAKFLSLIPSCCEVYKQPSRPTSPNSSGSTTGSDGRVKIDMKTHSDLVFYKSPILSSMYLEVCTDYMDYLSDARIALRNCMLKCRCWSAPYDGQNPPPVASSGVDRERSDSSTIASGSLSCPKGSIPSRDSTAKTRALSDVPPSKESPDLGMFINTLFQKVEKMPQNTFYVNLILTGVITRLACYPQPLLKSFLLNYNMILKPGVRSLFQILSSVKIRVESIVGQMDGLDRLLRKAQMNLIIREEKSRASIQSAFTETNPFDPQNNQRKLIRQRTNSALLASVKPLLKDGPAPKGFDPLARRQSSDSSTTTSTLSLNGSNESLASLSPQFGSLADLSGDDYGIPKPGTVQKASPLLKNFPVNQRKLVISPKNTYKRRNPKAIKNAVYCVLVLEEWLKELAAVSQEHALSIQTAGEGEVPHS